MQFLNQPNNLDAAFFFIDFAKASPAAMKRILKAMDSEVVEAAEQKRVPLLTRALHRLVPPPPADQIA